VRQKTTTALVTALTAAVALIGARPAYAIAHGEDAAEGRYAFTVKLTMTGIPTADGQRRDSSCSGALIDPHWVITAGHCFRDARDVRVSHTVAHRTTATVGRTDLGGAGGKEAAVVAVRQSPTADVSLAKLDTAITGIEPIRLGTKPPAVGDVVRLTGYGLTSEDESTLATRLQTGQFTVGSVGGSVVGMAGRAPDADTSACPHDSGGPYFTQQGGHPTLVSVVSRGPTCPHLGEDLSARVDTIADWISGATGVALGEGPKRGAAKGSPAAADTPASVDVPAAAGRPWTWLIAPTLLLLAIGVVACLVARRRRRAYRASGLRRHRAASVTGPPSPAARSTVYASAARSTVYASAARRSG
jgi:hypothetical protein